MTMRLTSRQNVTIVAAMLTVVLGAIALTGCSHNYESVPLNLRAQGTRPVAVAVLDQRPYINPSPSGKSPDFVGVQYSLEGIPFDVKTGSGRPMAEAWAETIVSALRSRGFEARAVPTTNSMERGAVIRELGLSGSRGIFVGVKDWKVDARQAADLDFQIAVQVVDESGKVIGESGVGGRDHLGADFINGATFARDQSMAAFKAKLEQVLNDPKIVEALR